jgi:hypothetical protein
VKVLKKSPKVGSRWKSKIGKHDIEVVVRKVGTTTVALEKVSGTLNGSSKRGSLLRLPIDAFFRRYESA